MPFPEVNRVIYTKNPLTRVICQLRFPPILKVDSEVPAEFQERVRRNFPNYTESRELKVNIPPDLEDKIAPEMIWRMTQESGIKNHEFASEDGTWKINLTRTFLALTTSEYERWEQFNEKLKGPLQALIDIYSPAYFTRIGLRYIDVIQRSVLGLGDTLWADLLEPHILGILGSDDVGANIKNFESTYEIQLSDGESVARMVTGLVEREDETCYKIDTDFFNSTKMDIDSAREKLEYLRRRGSRLFQWCITDHLHEAMEPQEL